MGTRDSSAAGGVVAAAAAAAAATEKRVGGGGGSTAPCVAERAWEVWKVACISALSASSVRARDAPAMTSGRGGGSRLAMVSECSGTAERERERSGECALRRGDVAAGGCVVVLTQSVAFPLSACVFCAGTVVGAVKSARNCVGDVVGTERGRGAGGEPQEQHTHPTPRSHTVSTQPTHETHRGT